MHGNDGTKHSFAIQLPSAKHCRREERIMQLIRIFNCVLSRRKESRKRNLSFHLPAAIPFSPSLRLVENDSTYLTFQDIYDQHCKDVDICREDPMLAFADKLRTVYDPAKPLTKAEGSNLRMELVDEISAKMIPTTVLSNYMTRTMKTPTDLWTMRKQFGFQIATSSFMTYALSITSRLPSRFHWSRQTGLIYMSELLPAFGNTAPVIASPAEHVPFRFTPNMQHFLTPIGMEGVLTAGIVAIGRCLTAPEFDMEQQLSLFLRDEVYYWFAIHKAGQGEIHMDPTIRNFIAQNVDGIVRRAELLACKTGFEKDTGSPKSAPPIQNVISLISNATNPQNLARMKEDFAAWF